MLRSTCFSFFKAGFWLSLDSEVRLERIEMESTVIRLALMLLNGYFTFADCLDTSV